MDAALFQPADFARFRFADAQDYVGLCQYFVPVGADRGAGFSILFIGKAGTLSQPGLNRQCRTELDQFFLPYPG